MVGDQRLCTGLHRVCELEFMGSALDRRPVFLGRRCPSYAGDGIAERHGSRSRVHDRRSCLSGKPCWARRSNVGVGRSYVSVTH